MIETSVFGGGILPALQPYPTIHQLPLLSPLKGHGAPDAIHAFVVTYWTRAGKLGFLTVHGLMVASSTPMAVILFWQLWHIWHSSLMHTCIWRVRMWTCLKHRFKIFDTHGEAFFWTNSAKCQQSKRVPNTWRETCCRFEILWTLRRTPKPCLGVQLYVAIFVYLYIIYVCMYIYIYTYTYFKNIHIWL